MQNTIQELRTAYIIGGVIFCLYALPLMRRRVKPNLLFGIVRTARIISNPDLWYSVNAYAARLLFLLSSLLILIAVLLATIPNFSADSYLFCCIIYVLLASILMWRAILRYMNSVS